MLRRHLSFLALSVVTTLLLPTSAQADDTLLRAVNLDDERSLRRLLDAGASPNGRNAQGQPLLFLAMREGSFKAAAVLLAHPGLEVDAPTAAGETALMMAALRGHLEWAQKLVARGAAINRSGWTPLHYAASDAGTPVLRWLLDQGAAIDAPSPNRSTALMLAARYGASESVDLLLARGANARLRNDRGMDASDFARGAGRDRVAAQIAAAAAAATPASPAGTSPPPR
jgi:uncharacterized protein